MTPQHQTSINKRVVAGVVIVRHTDHTYRRLTPPPAAACMQGVNKTRPRGRREDEIFFRSKQKRAKLPVVRVLRTSVLYPGTRTVWKCRYENEQQKLTQLLSSSLLSDTLNNEIKPYRSSLHLCPCFVALASSLWFIMPRICFPKGRTTTNISEEPTSVQRSIQS